MNVHWLMVYSFREMVILHVMVMFWLIHGYIEIIYTRLQNDKKNDILTKIPCTVCSRVLRKSGMRRTKHLDPDAYAGRIYNINILLSNPSFCFSTFSKWPRSL